MKNVRGDELITSIRRVANGEMLLTPEQIDAREERLRRQITEDIRLESLSPQERRILDLLSEGLSNREIADAMFLAEKTVKNYVSNLLAKLGFQRRTEAALFAQRQQDRAHTRRRLSGGEDFRAVVGDRDGVFEVGRELAVLGHDAPAVVEHVGLVAADVDHRLDGEDHALLQRRSRRARASSWAPGASRASRCRWRGPTYSRTTENPAASATFCTARPTSLSRLPIDQLVDAGPQRALGHLDQSLRRRR